MENEAMENATSKNKMKTTKTGRPGKVGKTME
jgi:hypothetical protein